MTQLEATSDDDSSGFIVPLSREFVSRDGSPVLTHVAPRIFTGVRPDSRSRSASAVRLNRRRCPTGRVSLFRRPSTPAPTWVERVEVS